MKIGLLGGTFDPIHLGHLRAAEEVYEDLGLAEVLFIPAGTPPHKKRPDLSPFERRLAMTKLATEEFPHLVVTDLEGRLPGPSYSVRTLEILKKDKPGEFFFILGLDAFLEIETWFSYERLPYLAHLVVITRGPGGEREFNQKVKAVFPKAQRRGNLFIVPEGLSLRFLPVTRLEISSTMIRQKVKAGLSIRFLVPERVRAYIQAHRLYR